MRRFKSTTRFRSNETDSIDAGEFMPQARYLGFMLGPESDHDRVLVTAGSEAFVLGAGMVFPITPFDGQPRLECLRTFDVPVADGQSIIDVIGLECPEELACKPRRPPIRRYYNRNLAGLPGLTRVALGGRRHAMVYILVGQIGSVILRGVDDRYGNRAELLPSTALAAGGDGIAYHVGGTDHEELWPTLEIEIGTSTTGTIIVYACGEIGG